ncbi:MAG TPA: hypothetical protein VML35_07940 [Gaiellaceae bacterium]|nr:hypothetical protein [Gaiellaceae bacterium]
MRRLLLLVSLVASLAVAGEAGAAEVLSQDDQGRTIRFDVRAEGVDAEWYAALLRAAPHGDEISTVRINIVSWDDLRSICGRAAAGCYSRSVITVPAEQSDENAHTVVHEYAHHLDASHPIAGIREPNGTSTWWRARGMDRLVRLGSVARSYLLGWSRSIGEIFAEDYAQLARPGGPFSIPWLERPTETVHAAILADLGLGPVPTIAEPPALKPVSITRRGTLRPTRSASIDFGLLGPGRRVQATATFTGPKEKRVRAALEIRCNGRRVVLSTIGTGKTAVTIDRRNLGPAECTATLTSRSTSLRTFTLVVRLSIEAGA